MSRYLGTLYERYSAVWYVIIYPADARDRSGLAGALGAFGALYSSATTELPGWRTGMCWTMLPRYRNWCSSTSSQSVRCGITLTMRWRGGF
jgi:hypothetical protein